MGEITGGIMAAAQEKQELADAIYAASPSGTLDATQIQNLTERYQAGEITVGARSLLDALSVPQLLDSLNQAGLSLDKLDEIVAEGELREINSFSALVVFHASYAQQLIKPEEDYDAFLAQKDRELGIVGQIYAREGRSITQEEFLNGFSNMDSAMDSAHLVYSKDDLDYYNRLVERFKTAGIAGQDFSLTQGLINRSVFLQRENYEGPLSVVAHSKPGMEAFNTFPDYSKYDPKTSISYVVHEGENVLSVAARMQAVLGTGDAAEGSRKIALMNGSADVAGYSLQAGQILEIPLDPSVEVVEHIVQEGESLFSLTAQYNMASRDSQAMSLVAIFNGLQDKNVIQPGQVLYIPIRNDGADLSPVDAPHIQDNRQTTLYVTEPHGTHHFETYGSAVQYATSAFPGYQESGLAIRALNTSSNEDMSDTVDQLIRKGGDTDAVFSLSLSGRPSFEEITADARPLARQALDYYGHHAPKILISAGNNYQDDREQYSIMPQIGSRNAFSVGATQQDEKGGSYIAPYSSPGADFTSTPLIAVEGQKVFGTSFSAPTLAAAAAQMNTWYGDRLSFEEIMYTAMLSTRIDISDCRQDEGNECKAPNLETGIFVTNGAGLPHHARAGAGEIDLKLWKDNLDKLATLKQGQDLQNRPVTLDIQAADLVNARGPDHNGVYHYDVQVPADIMVGKMIAEAGPLVKVQIESPSGYQSYMGPSVQSAAHVATSAFAFEEYKAGDTIRIASDKPLDDQFRLRVQGQEPGSALGALRDTLQAEGKMLTPHSTYENGAKAGQEYVQTYFAQPMPEQQLAELEKIRAPIAAPPAYNSASL